jgi:hypothetical protein
MDESRITTRAPGGRTVALPAIRRAWALQAYPYVRAHATAIALSVVLAAAVSYWLWFGATARSINFDDGISILAAQGIVENGYPRLPSGFFYHRGYIPHYLLAMSLAVLGTNSLSIMLPSMVMAIGTLFLVFRAAKDILGRPMLGVGVVGLLAVLQIEAWYATGPRMYAALQFFALLAVYSAWRGFVLDENKFKPIATLALACAILTHSQGVTLVPALALGILIALWLRGQPMGHLLSLHVFAGLIIIGAVGWFTIVYTPANPLHPIVIHDGTLPNRISFDLSPVRWAKDLADIEQMLPYGLAPLFMAYLVAHSRPRHLFDHSRHGLSYLLLVLTLSLLAVGLLGSEGTGPRYFFFVLPLYALAACVGGVAIVRALVSKRSLVLGQSGRIVAALLLLAGGGMSIVLATLQANGPYLGGAPLEFVSSTFRRGLQPMSSVRLGYGLPCPMSERACLSDIKPAYEELRTQVATTDFVVSYETMETYFFLGRVDGYLRQRMSSEGEWGAFTEPRDEYFGAVLIDSPQELRELRDADQRVWVIVNPQGDHLGPEMTDILEHAYRVYLRAPHLVVYVNQ